MRRANAGMTLVEVIVSLTLLAVLTAVLSTTFVSSLRTNADAASQTTASQFLSAVAEKVAQHDLIVNVGETKYYAYASTSTTTTLTPTTPITSCEAYLASTEGRGNICVKVSNTETFNPTVSGASLLSSDARLYTVQVNWMDRGVSRSLETKSIY